jgi:hypothetical protein
MSSKPEWEAGGESNAAKEAEEKKRGGKVMGEGEKPKMRHDRPARARGGQVPGRKRGGGIGANLTPLSTAARVKHVTKGEEPEEGVPSE